MDNPADNPGVIAPPPLIALAALLLGLALDWLLPPFILRGLFGFWTRLVLGGMLIAAGIVLATLAVRSFRQAGTNVEPWKPSVTLVADVYGNDPFYRWSCYRAWV